MVRLSHSATLSLFEDDENLQGVHHLATVLNGLNIAPPYDKSAYRDDLPLDDHFSIRLWCTYTQLNTDVLKEYLANQVNNNNNNSNETESETETETEEDDEEDDYYPPGSTTDVSIDKTIRCPVQGFPTSYEEAWHVVYKWVEEEFYMISDSYVLPLVTEELAHWALYLVAQIPKGRKKLHINVIGHISETCVYRPPNLSNTNIWFIIEVAAYEKAERLHDKRQDFDEEFVINVFSEYRPIESKDSVCKVQKLCHPAHELWDLRPDVFADIVSLMLKQVDLPGELPLQCIFDKIIHRAKSLILDIAHEDDYPKTLELNAIVRITEVLHPTTTTKDGDVVHFSRLSVHPDLLLKPLLSCHF